MGAPERKRRRPAASRRARPGFPTFEHNAYTVEGEIEQIGEFASAAATRPGCRRAAIAMLVGFLVLIVAQIVVHVLTGWEPTYSAD